MQIILKITKREKGVIGQLINSKKKKRVRYFVPDGNELRKFFKELILFGLLRLYSGRLFTRTVSISDFDVVVEDAEE